MHILNMDKLPWLDGALDNHFKKPISGALSKPERIGVEITNACNLNCAMCNTKLSVRKPELMKLDAYSEYIKAISSWAHPPFVELYTVGETFIHPKLGDMIQIAYDAGIDVHLSTNAQYPEQTSRIYERFSNNPPKLFLSIDGATKETFEAIRIGARFERVFETLDRLRYLEGEIGKRFPIYLRSILSMDNIKEVYQYFAVYGGYFETPRNINFQLINGISPDRAYFREAVPFENLIYKKWPCHMPFRNLYITVDGRLTPCARDYDADLVIGEFSAVDPKAAWESVEAELLRDMHRDYAIPLNGTCIGCEDTHRLARTVSNEYIHYYMESNFDGNNLHIGIIDLLSELNDALGHEVDREGLIEVIVGCFRKAGDIGATSRR